MFRQTVPIITHLWEKADFPVSKLNLLLYNFNEWPLQAGYILVSFYGVLNFSCRIVTSTGRRWFELMRCWQIDANNKREAELRKVKRELEDTQAQRDSQLSTMRKKNQDVANELNEQIDQLQKAKQK